jgi:hypothetical protein
MGSVIDSIYTKINDVIGGSNPNQFFTLLFPGTLLNAKDYSKPPSIDSDILLRSSLLANSLFDPCEVTAAGNGRMLHDQYGTALGTLIPKLNPKIEALRKKLRDALSVKISATLPDGTPFSGTKLALLTKLTGLYNQAVREWNTAQAEESEKLKQQYADDPDLRKEAFNQWYAAASKEPEGKIDEAHSQISMVLSPDELGLIDGILDSGNIAIKTAKEVLRRALIHYPEGDAYRVLFTPSDWPTLLKSDFGYVDLLASPEHIDDQIALKQKLIDEQLNGLDLMAAMIPSDLQKDIDAVTTAQQSYQTAQQAIIDVYTDSAATAVKIYLAKYTKDNKSPQERTTEVNTANEELKKGTPEANAAGKKGGGSAPLTVDEVNTLVDNQKKVNAAQIELQTKSAAYAAAALKLIGDQAQYANLKPFYEKLKKASQELADLRTKLAVVSKVSTSTIQQIFPNNISERFSQVQVDFLKTGITDKSSLSSSFTQTSWGASLFFGSVSGNKAEAESKYMHEATSSETSISIGMLVAKVDLSRTWFRPGVFLNTGDMQNLSGAKISHGERDAKAVEDILPTFPVAFVIAKDITIKLTLTDGKTQQVSQILDKHGSAGGGFLCFSASHSEAEHSEDKSFSSYVQGTNVVIRIPAPQIIGWYQELVTKDNSAPITDLSMKDLDSFLSQYQALNPAGGDGLRNLRRAA